MKTLLFIIVLMFGGVSALYSRFKRVVAEGGDSTENYNSVESSDDVENNDFFGFDSVEAEEAVANQPEYFTYESADVVAEPVQSVDTVVAASEDDSPRFAFDLRQAVIFQAMLNNRYFDLEKQNQSIISYM